MAVKIGHASLDERGCARGGQAGDQTGREVFTRNWYNGNWDMVIRPREAAVAEKIAAACEAGCANNKIGYDQSQRTTLFQQAKANHWDLSRITENCETDCSAFVAVCVNAAGVSVSRDIYTGNQAAALRATGRFDFLTEAKYRTREDYLRRGDILLRESGHTAMVLTTGTYGGSSKTGGSTALQKAMNFDRNKAGSYQTTAALNLRYGPDSGKYASRRVMARGETVKCYGFFTRKTDADWLYVVDQDGCPGFACGKYLRKI